MTPEELRKMIKEYVSTAVADVVSEAQAKAQTNIPKELETMKDKPIIKAANDTRDAARCIRYLYLANNDPQRAAEIAKAEGADYIAKAMSSTDLTAGGALVPQEFSAAIIAELGAKAVLRKAGPKIMPLLNGSMILPAITTAPTSSYVTENSNITSTDAVTGDIQLVGKHLACVTPFSNQLLSRGGPAAERALIDSVVRSMSRKEDVVFIRSLGVSGEPKGLRYWAQDQAATNIIAANGTVSLANTLIDLGKIELALDNNNIDGDNLVWFFAPRTRNYLMNTAQTTTGETPFRNEMSTGKLYGKPFFTTTQIPVNLGGATNESEIYLVDMSSVVLGEEDSMRIDFSKEATYYDGSANQSAFAKNQSVVRALSSHDLVCEYRGLEVAVLTGVKWGT